MTRIKHGVILLLLLALMGCANDKPSSNDRETASNSVGVLFTVDGVTVYRFGDQDRYHYFAVKTGRPDTVTLSGWTESCGKNCTKYISETVQVLAADH